MNVIIKNIKPISFIEFQMDGNYICIIFESFNNYKPLLNITICDNKLMLRIKK